MASKRWRLPDTEIDFVRIDNGPRAGEYLASAETIDRLPGVLRAGQGSALQTGPAEQLSEVYRTISDGGSATIYDAFLGSPAGFSYRPAALDARPAGLGEDRVPGVALWQWLGLAWLAYRRADHPLRPSLWPCPRRRRPRRPAPAGAACRCRWRSSSWPVCSGPCSSCCGSAATRARSSNIPNRSDVSGRGMAGDCRVGSLWRCDHRIGTTDDTQSGQSTDPAGHPPFGVAAVAVLIKGGDQLGFPPTPCSPAWASAVSRWHWRRRARSPTSLAHCLSRSRSRSASVSRSYQRVRGHSRRCRLPQHAHPHAGQFAGVDPEQHGREHNGGESRPAG